MCPALRAGFGAERAIKALGCARRNIGVTHGSRLVIAGSPAGRCLSSRQQLLGKPRPASCPSPPPVGSSVLSSQTTIGCCSPLALMSAARSASSSSPIIGSRAAAGCTDEGPFPTYLLDGRNRLAALKLLGITDPHDAPKGKGANYMSGWAVKTYSALVATSVLTSRGASKPKWLPDVNPVTFVLSRNVHRRHLTSEQKRQAIAAYLKADPTTSDRKVAKELGVDNKTAAKVRADLDSSNESSHHFARDRRSWGVCCGLRIVRSAILHTGDPVLTSGRVKGGEAIT